MIECAKLNLHGARSSPPARAHLPPHGPMVALVDGGSHLRALLGAQPPPGHPQICGSMHVYLRDRVRKDNGSSGDSAGRRQHPLRRHERKRRRHMLSPLGSAMMGVAGGGSKAGAQQG